jgi:fumarate reductase subunit C
MTPSKKQGFHRYYLFNDSHFYLVIYFILFLFFLNSAILYGLDSPNDFVDLQWQLS